MRPPKLTVALQYYNNRNTIAAAIISILNQSHFDFELILCCDGSQDGTDDVAKNIRDPRIRHIGDKRNLGRPTRINACIDAASGEYFALADGDDVCMPDRFQSQIQFLESNREIDLVGSWIGLLHDGKSISGIREFPTMHGEICRLPIRGFGIAQPTFMGRTNWFRAYRYNNFMRRAQDQELLLRSFRTSRFANVPAPLVAYRVSKALSSKPLLSRLYWLIALSLNRRNIANGNRKIFSRLKWPVSAREDEVGKMTDAVKNIYRITNRAPCSQALAIARPPTISIALPVLNGAATLAATLKSLIWQTYGDWELILIDDGSTDGTLRIAESIKDPRILVISDGVRRGLSVRLNQAIDLARGKYFARIDADDICYPTRLWAQLDFMEKNEEIDLCGSSMAIFSSDGALRGIRRVPKDHSDIVSGFAQTIKVCHPTYFGKTNWFKQWRYAEGSDGAEDQHMLMRAARKSRYANIESVLVAYREDAISLEKLIRYRKAFACACRDSGFVNGPQAVFLFSIAQAAAFAMDAFAAATRMTALFQPQRTKKLRSGEAKEWTNLWRKLEIE